jgi:hypothetical protein
LWSHFANTTGFQLMPNIKKHSERKQSALYQTLCRAISEGGIEVNWGQFSDADWRHLAELAGGEGVSSLLYRALKEDQLWGTVPEAVRDALAKRYYADAAHNQLLFHELAEILGRLSQAGVPVIVLKGAALAFTIYTDPAMRPMNDIDIFVHPEHLFTAIGVLRSIGYEQQKITYHAVLTGGADGHTTIELHWLLLPDLADSASLNDWFWRHTQVYSGLDSSISDPALMLSPTGNLLYLPAHLQSSGGGSCPRLIWCYDIFLLSRQSSEGINWDEVRSAAGNSGWLGALDAALQAVEARFPGVIPPNRLQNAKSDIAQVEGKDLSGYSFDAQDWSTEIYIRQALDALRWSDRGRVVWGLIFPSREYMQEKYAPRPSWAWPLWWLVRWVELARATKLLVVEL